MGPSGKHLDFTENPTARYSLCLPGGSRGVSTAGFESTRDLEDFMRIGIVSLLGGAILSCASVGRAQGVPEAPDPGGQRSRAAQSLPEHPLVPAISLVKERCIPSLKGIQDYEAVFTKRELIQGKLTTQVMQMRLREQPFSVYLRFGGDFEGREILFVQGQNNNQLIAHEGSGFASLAGTMTLDPKGEMAMGENHYPITHIGMRNLITQVLDQWEIESKYGEVDVKYFPQAKLGDRSCEVIECSHPQPRREFRFHVCRVFLDKELKLPVRVENYGFPTPGNQNPPLHEEYTYSNIKVNVGLQSADFDRKNPKYKF